MTDITGAPTETIERLVEAQHDAAVLALTDSAGEPLDAVGWISAHVAATEMVLHPAVPTRPDRRRLVANQRRVDRRLVSATWDLDRRLTGDVHHAAASRHAVAQAVLRRLDEHAAAERQLLDALATLDAGTVRQLRDKLEKATMHAPTRPHPLTPAGAPGWRLAIRLESLVDRVRDALDARHVPVPRVRRQRHVPGRWGNYALGGVDAFPTELGSDIQGSEGPEMRNHDDASTP
jgi:hypothetical protein